MNGLKSFIDALYLIRADPIALLGYVFIVAAWLVVGIKSRRAETFRKAITLLPEGDRLAALNLEYRATPRSGLSAEQWIRSRIHVFLLSGFGITVAALLIYALSAFVYERSHPDAPCIQAGNNITQGDNSPIVPCNNGVVNISPKVPAEEIPK